MRQTTRVGGKRVVITTGKSGVKVTDAEPLEWELQAAQIEAIKNAKDLTGIITYAGDQNAARRGPKARAMALKSGMIAGEPDLRIYCAGGRLLSIENKVGNRKASPTQIARHKLLRELGFDVVIINASSTNEAASLCLEQIRRFISKK